jgi:hypothetical protein
MHAPRTVQRRARVRAGAALLRASATRPLTAVIATPRDASPLGAAGCSRAPAAAVDPAWVAEAETA